MLFRLSSWFLVCLAIILTSPAWALSSAEFSIPLTEAEENWAADIVAVRYGVVEGSQAPLVFAESGQLKGIAIDYLKRIDDYYKIKFEARIYPDAEKLQQAFDRSEIDLILAYKPQTQQDAQALLSTAYVDSPLALFALKNRDDVATLNQLADKLVALDDDKVLRKTLTENYAQIELYSARSSLEALERVASEQADVYLGSLLSANYALQHSALDDVEFKSFVAQGRDQYVMALRPELTLLHGIINKALSSMTRVEHRAIRNSWVRVTGAGGSIGAFQLSPSEARWLDAHPVIRLGADDSWRPFDFIEDGIHKGVSADFVEILRNELGLEIKRVPDLSWLDILSGVKNKEVDLVSAISPTKLRSEFMLFSSPYVVMPWVLVTRIDNNYILSLNDLQFKRVGVVANSAIVEMLEREHPNIELVDYSEYSDGLAGLANGEVDGLIGNFISVGKLIQEHYLGSLKVASSVLIANQHVSFGVRDDWPEFVRIVNKVLANVEDKDSQAIRNAWFSVYFDGGLPWRKLIIILAAVALVFILILLWNRLLRRQIRERERAELALNNQLGFQKVLLDTIPNPIYVLDPQCCFIECNAAFEQTFGLRRQSLLGKPLLELEDSAQMAAEFESCLHLLSTRGSEQGEINWRLGDGREHDFLIWRSVFSGSNDKLAGLLCVLVDISDRKQQERALAEAKDVAELATKSKSSFLAAMSHEIRTPMNGILGLLELLRLSPMESEPRRRVKTIWDSSKALLQILNDILDYSKIEADKLILDPQPSNLKELAESVVNTLAYSAFDKSLNIDLFIDPRVASALLLDDVRMRQILFNLFSNAIKFTESGHVALSLRWLSDTQEGQRLLVEVSDSGIGISQEQLEKLFTPFVQAETSTTRRFGGTGLGLSICKRLSEAMGFELEMQSCVGEGTQVRFEALFAHCSEASENAADAGELGSEFLSSKKVVVLESDAVTQRSLSEYLSCFGAEPILASPNLDFEAFDELCSSSGCDFVFIAQSLIEQQLKMSVEALVKSLEAKLIKLVIVNDRPTLSSTHVHEGYFIISRNPLQLSALERVLRISQGSLEAQALPFNQLIDAAQAPPSREQAISRGTLILVAEDHPINQQVIMQQLSILGHAADIKDNGLEALNAWRSGDYSLLLSDCHMPVMDGYTLASMIRSAEEERGEAGHVPIIAITANALHGEAEKCRAAGMDDYMVKPLELPVMQAMIMRYLPAAQRVDGQGTGSASVHEVSPKALLNSESLLQLFGSEQVVVSMLREFIVSNEEDLRALRLAIDAEDQPQLSRIAHRIKGAAEVIGAERLADSALLLEQAPSTLQWQDLQVLLDAFWQALDELQSHIQSL